MAVDNAMHCDFNLKKKKKKEGKRKGGYSFSKNMHGERKRKKRNLKMIFSKETNLYIIVNIYENILISGFFFFEYLENF